MRWLRKRCRARPRTSRQGISYRSPISGLGPCRARNPGCGAIVPMVRQTWLCKRGDRFVAMKMVCDPRRKKVRFEIVEADSEDGFDFDPSDFSKGGTPLSARSAARLQTAIMQKLSVAVQDLDYSRWLSCVFAPARPVKCMLLSTMREILTRTFRVELRKSKDDRG